MRHALANLSAIIRNLSWVASMLIASTQLANAALILTIDNYTADELAFSISGIFDSDTVGQVPGYLALKNDWSGNIGMPTELFMDTPAVILNTIQIGGIGVGLSLGNSVAPFNDSVWFINPNGGPSAPIAANTTVTGSVVLSAVGAFDPFDAATLELVSGWNPSGSNDWVRLEAIAAVPVPAAAWLFGSALGLLGFARHRIKKNSR